MLRTWLLDVAGARLLTAAAVPPSLSILKVPEKSVELPVRRTLNAVSSKVIAQPCPVATARASLYIYNDEDDVDALVDALIEMRKYFGV